MLEGSSKNTLALLQLRAHMHVALLGLVIFVTENKPSSPIARSPQILLVIFPIALHAGANPSVFEDHISFRKQKIPANLQKDNGETFQSLAHTISQFPKCNDTRCILANEQSSL